MTPDDMLTFMPFARATGVELVIARKDEVVGRLAWAAERTTAGGVLHGGAIRRRDRHVDAAARRAHHDRRAHRPVRRRRALRRPRDADPGRTDERELTPVSG